MPITTVMPSSQEIKTFVKVSDVESSGPIFQAISPFSTRAATRHNKECEEIIEFERDNNFRFERRIQDLQYENEKYRQELDDANLALQLHIDNLKKRDAEILILRKALEETKSLTENLESGIHRKYKTTVTDLSSEIQILQKQKDKAEKGNSYLLNEIESNFLQLDQAIKEKDSAESRIEGMEGQIYRLKGINEDLQRQLNECLSAKLKFQEECSVLEQNNQDFENKLLFANKKCTTLQVELDDLTKQFQEECQARAIAQGQLNSLQQDHDLLQCHYEEESEISCKLRTQISKINSDMVTLKTKYEKEVLDKNEQIEELRRKLTQRISELEDALERERSRASSFEKSKNKLTIDLKALENEILHLESEINDEKNRTKNAEAQITELNIQMDDLNTELLRLSTLNSTFSSENQRVKVHLNESLDKIALIERENRQLVEDLIEQKNLIRECKRQISDLESAKALVEQARDHANADLQEAEDALHQMELKYQVTISSLAQYKSEIESQLREKDDEINSMRKSTQHTIEELNKAIEEMESKYKADMARTKKKFESSIHELEAELNALNHANILLDKRNNELDQQIKEMDTQIVSQQAEYESLLSNLQTSERRRMKITDELDQMRVQFEGSEKSRKATENDLFDTTSKISELNIQINNLINDKRKLESEVTVLQADFDDAISSKEANEEKINYLKNEVVSLAEDLQIEQDNHKKAETIRKNLENEIREMATKLEFIEVQSTKDSRKAIQKLQSRIRDLEVELESQTQVAKESQVNSRKSERQLKDITQQAEEDRRLVLELQDLLDKTQMKMKTYKRQAEEAEELANITLTKYRKAQRSIEEAEIRATMAERSIKHSSSHKRSSSTTRAFSVGNDAILESTSYTPRFGGAANITNTSMADVVDSLDDDEKSFKRAFSMR